MGAKGGNGEVLAELPSGCFIDAIDDDEQWRVM